MEETCDHVGNDSLASPNAADSPYWTKKLAGCTPESFPDLTGNRSNLKRHVFERKRFESQIGRASFVDGVGELKSTPLAVAQAAWALLLYTYSESDTPSIVFGSSYTEESLHHGICFPVTFDTSQMEGGSLAELSVAEVLTRFERDNTEAVEHPFTGAVAGALNLDTSISVRSADIKHAEATHKHSVLLVVDHQPSSNAITLSITYSTSVLTSPAALGVLQQFDDVLAYILAHPDAHYLSAYTGIRPTLQSSQNSEPRPLATPAGPLLHSWFEKHAREDPHKLALWFKYSLEPEEAVRTDVRWTYKQLNERANRLARLIRGVLGGVKDEPIALLMEKCPGLYMSTLAVLKAGGAWCPLDAAAPALRNRDMLSRAGGRLVIFDTEECKGAAFRDEVIPEGIIAISLEDPRLDDEKDSSDLNLEIPPEDLAYLIWTSGTTGLPKGVPVEHRAIVQTIASEEQVIPWDEETGVRHMQFSAATFDVSITDIFYTWAKPCGTVTSATRELLIGKFPNLVNAFKATHCNLTPSFMATFSLSECPTMKVICSEGEKLPDVVADSWNIEGAVSINCYGPAECAVTIITRSWRTGEEKKAANVGHPLASGSCFVVKNEMILPRGAVGELALGGPQLARGYLGQPDTTATKFVQHPVAGRVYLTGDFVRFLHDGTCEFVGRNDDLIKLGGIRIELSEISALLNRCHPLAKEAATLQLCRPDRPMDIICTFISVPSLSPDGTQEPSPLAVEISNAARDMAERTLPSYMRPNLYIPLPHIPVTPSNKTDRKALAVVYAELNLSAWERATTAGESTRAEVDTEDNDEWIEVETKMRDAIVALTDVAPDAVRKNTQLKSLGIDSIRAIMLSSRFRTYGLDIAVADILQHNTVRELKLVLEGPLEAAPKAEDKPVHQRLVNFNQAWLPVVQKQVHGVKQVLPCTPLQEGMLGEMVQDSRVYWSHHLLTLEPEVDLNHLRKSWEMVVNKNDALRIGFVATGSLEDSAVIEKSLSTTFIQLLFDKGNLDWTTIETNDPPEVAIRKRCDELTSTRIGSTLPPWALSMFALKNRRRTLILSIHHSIHDGDTLNFIFNDVQLAYSVAQIPVRTQFSQALAYTQPDSLDSCSKYWAKALQEYADEDAPAFPNLAGRSRPRSNHQSMFISNCIPTTTTSTKLLSTAQGLQCPLGNLVQAAFAVVLCSYLETTSVVFGETTSDRPTAPQVSSAMGPLITATPVVCHIGDGKTARTLVKQLTESYGISLSYRHVQLAKIKTALKRPKDQPVFPAMFVVHVEGDSEDESRVADQLWRRQKEAIGVTVEHTLALNVEVRCNGKIDLDLWADSSVISVDQLDLLVREIDAVLSAIIADPDQPLASITSLTTFPKQFLSIAEPVPSTNLVTARDRPPTWWLEYYALHNPDHVAAIVASSIEESGTDTKQWTYHELNEASNRVANLILSLGVRRKVVAFCLDRTLEAYAYQLGIFKSGNIYLPIEEELPTTRKTLLVNDSKARLVFTTAELNSEFSTCNTVATIVNIEDTDHQAKLSTQSLSNPIVPYLPESASYLLYTSGSTGIPKGVLVSNRNLSTFIEAFVELLDKHCPTRPFLGKGRYLGRTSNAFDVHLLELFGAFRLGMAAATAPRALILDDLRLAIQRLQISHASLVPSLLERAGLLPSEVPSLRWMSVGGEKISSWILDNWGNNPSGFVLFNAYGPTELTIGCSIARVTQKSSPRSIGHIFNNSTAYVLRPGSFDLALRGEPGELCVAGDLVAIGYLDRPDAKGFVDDFSGRRLYRTGDMVRLMADDSIDYLGRSDDQAKIRGQRLELAEVTEFLRSQSKQSLALATLIVRHPEVHRDWLVSFVGHSAADSRKRGDTDPTIDANNANVTAQLRRSCMEQLPAFMVPDLIIMLNFIPLAATSGKADAKVLRRIITQTSLAALLGDQPTSTRPLNRTETQICDILSQLVAIESVEKILPHTTTLQLGVDSLSAISLSFRLAAAGFDAPIPFLMGGPSIEQIASRATALASERATSVRGPRQGLLDQLQALRARLEPIFPRNAIMDIWPTLPLQEGLVARSMDSSSPAYINHLIFSLKSDDVQRLEEAWSSAIMSHDILRTCFPQEQDQIVQIVLNPAQAPTVWHNRNITDDRDPREVIQTALRDISHDIVRDVASTPPLRLYAWKGKRGNHMSLSIHHALYDGVSLPKLLREVEARYAHDAVTMGPPFSVIVEHVAGQSEEHARSFFMQYLEDLRLSAPLKLVTEGLRSSMHEDHLAHRLSDVEERIRGRSISLHAYAQAAYAVALAEHFRHDDMVFGVVLSGRSIPIEGADDIMGPCVTTIPLRTRLHNGMTVGEVAQQIQADSSALLTHQHTPIRAIQRWIGTEQPLFDVLFSFNWVEPLKMLSELWEQCAEITSADHHLAMEVEASRMTDTVVVRATYTTFFGEKSSRRIISRVLDLLTDLDARVNVASSRETPAKHSVQRQRFDEDTWTTEEETIRAAISEICRVELNNVTKNVSFLRLGLDSISSIRLSQRLRRVGINVRSSIIMANASVGLLAQCISSHNHSTTSEDFISKFNDLSKDLYTRYAPMIPTTNEDDVIEGVFPATPLQTAMLSSTLASNGNVYVIPHPQRLSSGVNTAKLRAAWETVVSRLGISRTTFHPGEEFPWIVVVHRIIPVEWKEHTIGSSHNLALQIRHLLTLPHLAAPEGFERPPIEAHIVRTSTDTLFIPVLHHSLYDGLSLQYIFEDVFKHYHGLPAPERPLFSAALPYVLNRPDGDIEFWCKRLQGYEPFPLQALIKDQKAAAQSCERTTTLSASTIETLCQALEITVHAAVILAWGKVLVSIVGRRDVVFGHVVSGRSLPLDDAFEIAGPLFNTVPYRVTIPDGTQTNGTAAKAQHSAIVMAEAYQHTPLRNILSAIQDKRSPRNLFDTLFVFQRLGRLSEGYCELPSLWTPFGMDTDEPEYALNIDAELSGDSLTLHATCRSGIMNHEQLSNLLESLDQTLINVVHDHTSLAIAFPPALRNILPTTLAPTSKPSNGELPSLSYDKFDSVEEQLREILAELAQVDNRRIGRKTPLYAIGLDSISAIQIASRCRRQGLDFSVADILGGGHIEGICSHAAVRSQTRKPSAKHEYTTSEERAKAIRILGLPESIVEDVLPALPGQQFHLAAWLACGRTFYEAPFVYRLRADVKDRQLAAAWRRLRARHSILRTAFSSHSSNRAFQVVLKEISEADPTFTLVSTNQMVDSAVRAILRSEGAIPPNMRRPPVRAIHIQAKDGQAFVIMLHHALYDAWSLPLLIADFNALYRDGSCLSNPKFGSLVMNISATRDDDKHRVFWARLLGKAEPTRLRDSAIALQSASSAGAASISTRVKIAALRYLWPSASNTANPRSSTLFVRSAFENVPSLNTAALKSSASTPALLLASVARVVARLTGIASPTIGHSRTARSAGLDAIEKIAGPALNELPILVTSALDGSIGEVAGKVQEDLGKMVAHEQVGWADTLEWAGQAGTVLCDVHVNIMWASQSMYERHDDKAVLRRWDVGVPTDFAPSHPIPGETAVDGLDHCYIAKKSLMVEFALNPETGHIDLGVRNDGPLLSSDALHAFVEQLTAVIEEARTSIALSTGSAS